MSAVVVLCLLAGLSEAAGRVLPLVARRPGMSRTLVIGLLLAGALIEGAVIALWPLVTWTLAELMMPTAAADTAGLVWTPGLIAPLVLAAILAFPLLGPLLHLLLIAAVGVSLTGPLADATGLDWGLAAVCVAAAGLGLAVAVDLVRRLVAMILATGVPEPVR
ncbi:hypothetical protein GCM10009789_45920 [Kribbella sancticallisti]|uniref:Integral membrane protein n=1 Tax=Kribbella sancticallisti TaxID=460087 RepID=A0ABP4PRT6_9ACTN